MGQTQANKFEKYFTLICTNNYDELSKQFRLCSTAEQLETLANLTDTEKAATLLMYAAYYGDPKITKLLIESGADVLSNDAEGRHCLFYAIAGKSVTVVQYFIEIVSTKFDEETQKEFLNTQDRVGDTCLHEAVKFNRLQSIELLIKYSININTRNKEGITALHRAIDLGHHDIVRLLLKSKADVNIKDLSGWTSLHVAAAHNDIEMVRLLVNRGARINVTDLQGHSPLKWARETNSQDVFAYLKSQGAKEFESSTSNPPSARSSQRSNRKQMSSPKVTASTTTTTDTDKNTLEEK